MKSFGESIGVLIVLAVAICIGAAAWLATDWLITATHFHGLLPPSWQRTVLGLAVIALWLYARTLRARVRDLETTQARHWNEICRLRDRR